MNNLKANRIHRELSDLFDAERIALISGNFSEVEAIYQKKKKISENLSDLHENMSRSELSNLQAKAKHNDSLFRSSLQGLKLAKNKINELQSTLSQLRTYDNGGKLTDKILSNPSVSKKY